MHPSIRAHRLFIATLLLLAAFRCAGAEEPGTSGRTIYVSPPERAGENGRIAAALAGAQAGDIVEIAAGTYRETITVPVSGLIIRAAESGKPGNPGVVILPAADGTTLTDGNDTIWRGIAFAAPDDGYAADLEGFTGMFENCAFPSVGGKGFAVRLAGGSPVFQGTRFGGGEGAALDIVGGDGTDVSSATADFRYCLFQDYANGVATLSGLVDVRFANCLLTRNGVLFTRPDMQRGELLLVNSVLYFNNDGDIVTGAAGSPPVRLLNCVYTPSFNSRLWRMGDMPEEQADVLVENSHCLSPRFAGNGRPIIVGLGIDDVRNLAVWDEVGRVADGFGYPITFGVNTAQATAEDWAAIRAGFARGHEVGSHSASHAPLAADAPVSVGAARAGVREARLEIDEMRALSVVLDGKKALDVFLDEDGLTMGELGRRLDKAGLAVRVGSYYRAVPARFLRTGQKMDIAFSRAVVPLALDTDEFLSYELRASRAALQREIPEIDEPVFITPFSVSSPLAKRMISRSGYVTARSNVNHETSGVLPGRPERFRVNLFGLPGFSLGSAKTAVDGVQALENVRLVLDYATQHCPILILYSHGYDEFDLEEWTELLKMLRADSRLVVTGLAEIRRRVRSMGEAGENGEFVFSLPERVDEFRPAADSPLLGSGVDLGLESDYAGSPLPAGVAPTIGLYQ